jgi:CelD/BcsL family acetyltransferase involved in cellulose biosynthesis
VNAGLQVDVVADLGALTPESLAGWRDLAATSSSPYATPEWMLAFWRHVHEPPGAQLRIVVVRDGERVVGVGPFYGTEHRGALGVGEFRVLGAGAGQRVGPLAAPGHEAAAAAAFATALAAAETSPSAIVFDAIDAASPFPALIADAWPGRRRPLDRDDRGATPGLVTVMAQDGAAWLRGRSRNYRRQQVRRRRDIESRGGRLRRSDTPEALRADLDAMFRLHALRFAAQGRHTGLGFYHAAVQEAAAALLATDAARLWVIDTDEGVVGGQLFVTAGDRMGAWNGGIDPAWERASLGLVLFDEAVRDAHDLGMRVLDFGAGDQDYKRHFADTPAPIAWRSLLIRDARYPLVRARLAPAHAREAARRRLARLPPERRRRLQRLLRRGAS